MTRSLIFLLPACLIMAAYTGCKKPSDNTTTVTSAFADSLRATCTLPFVGHGDSSMIYLPTAFTPNGDGLNDVYTLLGNSSFSSFLVTIYDTTGTLVYQSANGAFQLWDGTDQVTHSRSTKYKFYVKIKYTTAGSITDSGSTYVYLLSGSSCVNDVVADTVRYRFPDQFDPATGYNQAWSSFETYCH